MLLLALPLLLVLTGDRLRPARATAQLDLPPLMLWAWDRDDDLRFLDTRDTGVAYLAATLTLRGEEVVLAPRHNPLALPAGVSRVAVVHVESDRAAPAPSGRPDLGHGARLLVPQRELDRTDRGRRAGADVFPHGLRRPPGALALRQRWRFSYRALPHEHRDRDRRAAAGAAGRP